MADPTCFLPLTADVCISQANAISGAFVTSIASLLAVVAKYVFDRAERGRRQAFERSERESRQRFEEEQNRKRLTFEEAQATDEAARETAMQDYIKLGEWREESWERTRQRLDQVTALLNATVARIGSLIDQGPSYEDLQMIRETATALDSLANFKTEALHYSLPASISREIAKIIDQITKILLTLSPHQRVRQSSERKEALNERRTELSSLTTTYAQLCRKFIQNPKDFDGDA